MRRTIYLQMLYLINIHRSWVVVENGCGYCRCVAFRRGKAISYVSRVLRLRSMFPRNGYNRGTIWNIPEYELDRALAVYRKKNPDVRYRLKKGASYLEAKDAEAIIEIATYGLVRLELSELPLFKQY